VLPWCVPPPATGSSSYFSLASGLWHQPGTFGRLLLLSIVRSAFQSSVVSRLLTNPDYSTPPPSGTVSNNHFCDYGYGIIKHTLFFLSFIILVSLLNLVSSYSLSLWISCINKSYNHRTQVFLSCYTQRVFLCLRCRCCNTDRYQSYPLVSQGVLGFSFNHHPLSLWVALANNHCCIPPISWYFAIWLIGILLLSSSNLFVVG